MFLSHQESIKINMLHFSPRLLRLHPDAHSLIQSRWRQNTPNKLGHSDLRTTVLIPDTPLPHISAHVIPRMDKRGATVGSGVGIGHNTNSFIYRSHELQTQFRQ